MTQPETVDLRAGAVAALAAAMDGNGSSMESRPRLAEWMLQFLDANPEAKAALAAWLVSDAWIAARIDEAEQIGRAAALSTPVQGLDVDVLLRAFSEAMLAIYGTGNSTTTHAERRFAEKVAAEYAANRHTGTPTDD